MAADHQTIAYVLGGLAAQFQGGTPQGAATKSDWYKNTLSPVTSAFSKYYGLLNPVTADASWIMGNSKFLAQQNAKRNKELANAPQVVKDYLAGKNTNDPVVQYAVAAAQAARENPNGQEEGVVAQANQMKQATNLQDLYYKAWLSSQPPEMQKILGAPVAHMGYGKSHGMDPKAYTTNLVNELTALANNGYNIKTKSGSTAKQIQRLAPDLARYGVSSLNEIAAYKVTSPYTGKQTDVFYNTRTGVIIPTTFGSSMKGEGGSTYKLYNYNGRGVPIANWKDTSEAGDFAPLVMMAGLAAPFALGPLATSIGGSISSALGVSTSTGTMLAGAGLSGLTQGTLAAVSGGDFGKGFLTGALGSAIGSGVSSFDPGGAVANAVAPLGNTAAEATLNAAIGSGINKALSGALGAGAGALINGGDAGTGALSGALQGAVSGFAGSYLGDTLGGALGSVSKGLLAGLGGGGAPQAQAQVEDNATAAPSTATATGYGTGASLTPGVGYGIANQLTPRRGVGLIHA